MSVERRSFLKMSASALAAVAFGGLGFSLKPSEAKAQLAVLRKGKQTTSVCCYCAVGCGLIVNTDEKTKKAINVEGDPDHPINEGALCAKGASIWQLAENDQRIAGPMYRAPHSTKWEKKSWDWMFDHIAERILKTRKQSWQAVDSEGRAVNRVEAIASVGSAALDNEECWIYQGFLRSLGLVYIEHQARI